MKNKSRIWFVLILLAVALCIFIGTVGIKISDDTSIGPFGEDVELGLDLQGGVYVVLEAQTDLTGAELAEKMEETKVIIENRVNGIGVADPYITIESGDRIRVELAGLTDPQEAIDLIGKTALLEFKDPDGNVILTGANVESATSVLYENKPAVRLEFDSEGAEIFRDTTSKLAALRASNYNADTRISIVLDDKLQSDPPYVSETISDGKCIISGSYTQDEAIQLANVIQAGALPVELHELEVSAVGPSLGLQSYDTSVKAGLLGILLIFAYMFYTYRVSGLLADIALTIFIFFDILFMIILHVKITLPGIAGIVLTIGMAVDANVIIFERIKEEIKNGKSARVAVKSGFHNALSSIIDGNVTTMITGVVLFYFGTGLIKGFALTLLLGIVISMITAVIITKYLLTLAVNMGMIKDAKSFGIIHGDKKLDIVKNSKVFMGISGVIIVVGIAVAAIGGYNYGIDFTGGTLIQIDLGQEVSSDALREITDTIDKDMSIVHTGDDNEEIMLRTSTSLSSDERLAFFGLFQDKYNLEDDDLMSQEKFEPAIGGETQTKAVISVIIATICMLIYITIRFKFKFGIAAIIALIHDVLIALAVYALFKVPINSSFIAAILTIVGYSINDTIVVFDRVRENLGVMKKEKYSEIVNVSVSQTIRRSINTSITTLLAILCLYILGVSAIREFAFPLMVGVVAGTYSSIFIASPIWYLMQRKSEGEINSSRKR